jgi:hypothetical protein
MRLLDVVPGHSFALETSVVLVAVNALLLKRLKLPQPG